MASIAHRTWKNMKELESGHRVSDIQKWKRGLNEGIRLWEDAS